MTAPAWIPFALFALLYAYFDGPTDDHSFTRPARTRWHTPGAGTILGYRGVREVYRSPLGAWTSGSPTPWRPSRPGAASAEREAQAGPRAFRIRANDVSSPRFSTPATGRSTNRCTSQLSTRNPASTTHTSTRASIVSRKRLISVVPAA